jgi:hypothetical protein
VNTSGRRPGRATTASIGKMAEGAGCLAYFEWIGSESNEDLLLAKKVRWVFVTWTVVPICAVTRHFDSQWLAAFCILQHPLTVPTRDGLGLARKGPDGSQSSTSPLSGMRWGVVMVFQRKARANCSSSRAFSTMQGKPHRWSLSVRMDQ